MARLSADDGALDLTEYKSASQDEQCAAVIRWLQQNKGWLLILDNVDTREAADEVKKLVAKLTGGHVLITSRITMWSGGIPRFPLDVLSPDAAVALLIDKANSQPRTSRPDDAQQARVLAEQLGYLPLALTHAAAYIGESDLAFEDYLKEFDDALQSDEHDPIGYDSNLENAKILKTVATTYFLSIDRLGPVEKAILRAACFLAPAPIPIAMFADCPDEMKALVELWREETGEGGEEKSVRDAVKELVRYSLIERNTETFTIHRMERLVLAHRVHKDHEDRVPQWIEATRAVLIRYAPEETAENPKTWPVWDVLRPHAEAMVESAKADSRVKSNLQLLISLGQLYFGKGLYRQNLLVDEMALDLAERTDGPESTEFASRQLAYGETLRALGRYPEAEMAFRKSLKIKEGLDGPNSLSVASELNYVAIAVGNQGRTKEVEELLQRALAIYETEPDADKAGFAKVLTNLGNLIRETGGIEESERLCRRSIPLCQEAFGSAHPSTLVAMSNLATVLRTKGDYSEAESIYRAALAAGEPVLGPEHPVVLGVTQQLAGALEKTGDSAVAEQMLRRVIDAMGRVLGAEHPWTLFAVSNLADVLRNRGDYAGAEPLYRTAMEARKRALGPEHPDTLHTVNELAAVLCKTNNREEAESLFRLAMEANVRVLGPEHKDTLTSVNNLAVVVFERQDYAQAEPLLRRVLEGRERSLGPEHKDTLSSLSSLADLLEATGRFEEAVPLRKRFLEGQERKLGSEHPDMLKTWNNHSFSLRKNGLFSQAEPIDRHVVATTAKVLGATNPLTLHRRNNLVLTLVLLDKLAEARALLRENWQVKAESFANTTPRIAFLAFVVALLEARPGTPFLGQLKTLLNGPELPVTPGITVPWDIAYFIAHLSPQLPSGSADFLTALVAAMNDRADLPALEEFPQWRDQPPIPLDTPWPDEAEGSPSPPLPENAT
jgi:tetratricopeptide (TPR) repeat protein